MNRMIRTSLLCLALIILAACGRRNIDEELLPTVIATLDINELGAVVEPAEMATPEPPLPTPTSLATEAATVASEQTSGDALETSATLTATPQATLSAIITATPPLTVATILSETEVITPLRASDAPTITGEVSVAVAVTDTATLTAPTSLSDTDNVTAIAGVTTTVPVSEAESNLPAVVTPTLAAVDDASNESEGDADPYAGLPSSIAEALLQADPEHGQQLTVQNGCIGCHNVDPNVTMAGPTWHNIANTAATRVEGETAAYYLYKSIVAPNDYIVEGYPSGLMIQTFAQTISEQDLADIIAYLLTLDEE